MQIQGWPAKNSPARCLTVTCGHVYSKVVLFVFKAFVLNYKIWTFGTTSITQLCVKKILIILSIMMVQLCINLAILTCPPQSGALR